MFDGNLFYWHLTEARAKETAKTTNQSFSVRDTIDNKESLTGETSQHSSSKKSRKSRAKASSDESFGVKEDFDDTREESREAYTGHGGADLDSSASRGSQHLKESDSTPVKAAGKEILPIDEHRVEILHRISNNPVTIIHGETGCGKSSRLPAILLEEAQRTGEVKFITLICAICFI